MKLGPLERSKEAFTAVKVEKALHALLRWLVSSQHGKTEPNIVVHGPFLLNKPYCINHSLSFFFYQPLPLLSNVEGCLQYGERTQIIIEALSQLYCNQLYEFCFFTLIYSGPNPQIVCTSSDLSLLLLFISLGLLIFLEWQTCVERLFSTITIVGVHLTFSKPSQISLFYLSPTYASLNAHECAHL